MRPAVLPVLGNIVDLAGLDEAVRLSGVLGRWCDGTGRDPRQIRRSVQIRPDAARVVEEIALWVEAGSMEIVLHIVTDHPLAGLETISSHLHRLRPG
jgi:hypothetical protein